MTSRSKPREHLAPTEDDVFFGSKVRTRLSFDNERDSGLGVSSEEIVLEVSSEEVLSHGGTPLHRKAQNENCDCLFGDEASSCSPSSMIDFSPQGGCNRCRNSFLQHTTLSPNFNDFRSEDSCMDSPKREFNSDSDFFSPPNSPQHTPSPVQLPRSPKKSPCRLSGTKRRLLSPHTPPSHKMCNLRLFDSPKTPKSLWRNLNESSSSRNVPNLKITNIAAVDASRFVNRNPFSPVLQPVIENGESRSGNGNKRSGGMLASQKPPSKRPFLRRDKSRYEEEFHEISVLGQGEFGTVYKCANRVDGCLYAIKKSRMPLTGSATEQRAMREVYAHAVLGKHTHVVRYYTAWAEEDHMLIQNEFCNGGSLADLINKNKATPAGFCGKSLAMNESQLKQLLFHIAEGLRFIHSQGLVHLDVKPGNIFIHRSEAVTDSKSAELADIFEDTDSSSSTESLDIEKGPLPAEECEMNNLPVYKIGDLGHVTSASGKSLDYDVEEGDCRYMSRELLNNPPTHLTKCDIFALGLSVYEAGNNCELPKNGADWHAIRDGNIEQLPHCTTDFNTLVFQMLSSEPTARPSAATIVHHEIINPAVRKTVALKRRLKAAQVEAKEERLKNIMLQQQLAERNSDTLHSRAKRLVGAKMNRSISVHL